MSTPFFCDICGAALLGTVSICPACCSPVGSSPQSAPATLSSLSPNAASSGASTVPGVLPAGFLLARRYQIIRQLGQGGFSTVYKARDRARRNRLVAIKQIRLEMPGLQGILDAGDAYNREVTHLSQLRNKHLPRFYSHFTDEQNWYIVIEYIDGQTLEERLGKIRRGALPVMQVLDIGIALCDTLEYLHMQRPPLIFRDVKPANVIITRAAKLYLIDFGTTRPYRPGWKDTGPLGTPGYAAPEQYGRRAHTTPQTDIYGLGATLQTLLTGLEPLEYLQHGIPPALSRRIPSKLLVEIAHMQARDATRRPRNMAEVRQALQEIKGQFLSQKIKAAVLFSWEMLRETSAFASMSLILLVLLDFASFSNLIWPGVWIISLLAIAGFSSLNGMLKLRDARLEGQGGLRVGEKIAILWKQFTTSFTFSLLLSLFSYYLFSLFTLFNSSSDSALSTDQITSVVVVVASVLAGLGWLLRQLSIIRARRRWIVQHQQKILVQQTLQRRP